MGAGDGSVAGCIHRRQGRASSSTRARGACTATNLQPGATYISDIGGVANYTGNLEDVFTCIAALGETGCGFEHQFAAITRALGADGRAAARREPGLPAPRRLPGDRHDHQRGRLLARVPASPLFDTGSNRTLASQLGPPTNFRCNEFGHLCAGMAPRRLAPNGSVDDMFTYDTCEPAEDAGMLKNVAETVEQIKALKRDLIVRSSWPPSRGAPGRTPCTGKRRCRPTRRRGPRSHTAVRRPISQPRRSRYPYREPRVRLRRQGVRVLDLRLQLHTAAGAVRAGDRRPVLAVVHRQPDCRRPERAGWQPDCKVTARGIDSAARRCPRAPTAEVSPRAGR